MKRTLTGKEQAALRLIVSNELLKEKRKYKPLYPGDTTIWPPVCCEDGEPGYGLDKGDYGLFAIKLINHLLKKPKKVPAAKATTRRKK